MIMQAASQFSLLELSSDMLVWHLVLTCFDQVGLLHGLSMNVLMASGQSESHTSASDQALPPPVETDFLWRWRTGTRRLDISEVEDDLAVIGFCVGAYDMVKAIYKAVDLGCKEAVGEDGLSIIYVENCSSDQLIVAFDTGSETDDVA